MSFVVSSFVEDPQTISSGPSVPQLAHWMVRVTTVLTRRMVVGIVFFFFQEKNNKGMIQECVPKLRSRSFYPFTVLSYGSLLSSLAYPKFDVVTI